jgi:hypothetical protein
MNKMAKQAAIIMVMPSPMQIIGEPRVVEAVEIRQHPPLPAPPHVVMPAPLPPPMLAPPGIPVPTLGSPVMPPQMVALPAPPPVCCPCPIGTCDMAFPVSRANTTVEAFLQFAGLASDLCSIARTPSVPSICASALGLVTELCPMMYTQTAHPMPVHQPQCPSDFGASSPAYAVCPTSCGSYNGICCPGQPMVGISCAVSAPASAAKIHITAIPSSDELEMKVGGDTCIRCKKMTVEVGDNEISLSRFDDRVRVRGDELKATASSVRSDSKDLLILEGDVELHYKKCGHTAIVAGNCIELNLCSGAMTIKPTAKVPSASSVSIGKK